MTNLFVDIYPLFVIYEQNSTTNCHPTILMSFDFSRRICNLNLPKQENEPTPFCFARVLLILQPKSNHQHGAAKNGR